MECYHLVVVHTRCAILCVISSQTAGAAFRVTDTRIFSHTFYDSRKSKTVAYEIGMT